MMIKSDFQNHLQMRNNPKILKLLAIILITIGFLNSCNYKGRDFFEPPTGLTIPGGEFDLETPILLNPSNGAIGLNYMQSFEWNRVESASFYELQLAEDGQNFMQGMQFDTNTNMFEYNDLELQTDYSWRVRAGLEDEYSPWSDTWEFRTMDPQKLETPQLASPENGATDVGSPVQFNWNAVSDADFGYTFHLSSGSSFEDLLVDEIVDNTETTISNNLELNTPYFWRVKANGGEEKADPVESDWSDTWMFETITEDIDPPDIGLQKACIEHDVAVSYIKLLWQMNYLDTATAVNMIIHLKITGPGTDTTLEATPNEDLLFAHLLQISSYGLYVYQVTQILLNGESVEFTGGNEGEIEVGPDELNAGECDL